MRNNEPVHEEEERHYSWAKITSLNIIMLYSGLVSGVLGIGGGLLIGPMMNKLLHLRPEVQGATTNVLVFSGTVAGLMYL